MFDAKARFEWRFSWLDYTGKEIWSLYCKSGPVWYRIGTIQDWPEKIEAAKLAYEMANGIERIEPDDGK